MNALKKEPSKKVLLHSAMFIIPAKASDAQNIYALLCEVALWIDTKCKVQWPIDWLEGKKEEIFHSVSNGSFYTVSTDRELIAVVEIKSTPEPIWGYDATPAYYVHKLAVRRDCKNKGLGKKILNDVFNLAKSNKVPLVRLDCVTENVKLHEYYVSIGLTHMGYAYDEGTKVSLFELTTK